MGFFVGPFWWAFFIGPFLVGLFGGLSGGLFWWNFGRPFFDGILVGPFL